MTKPFLKYVGGKYKLLDNILPHLHQSNRLIEPFVGSGSIMLNTDYNNYICNDNNNDLINLYNIIKKDGLDFINEAELLFTPENNTSEMYYAYREEYNTTLDSYRKSALLVYLNKHCFSGLYRCNRSGSYNVPFGKYKNVNYPKVELINFYTKSQNVIFDCMDFVDTMELAVFGDCIYCDSPYSPLDQVSNFTAYGKNVFGVDEHLLLRDKAISLSNMGVTVVISNHDTIYTRELYSAAADNIISFPVKRNNAANTSSRKTVMELLAVYKSK